MAQTEAQRKATMKWRKENTKTLSIMLTPKDQDIIDYLQGIDKKAAYIRELIRRDMESNAGFRKNWYI